MATTESMDRESGTWVRVVNELVYFAWWIRLQRRLEQARPSTRWTLLGTCIAVGAVARLWAQTLPGNWDFKQWMHVSTAVLQGQDPYALYGYNYPPPWLFTLTLFQAVTDSPEAFRLLISLLLLAADIGIVLLLARRGYTLAACLFMLAPVTIAISGQHQQVEGIAGFLALAGVTAWSVSSGTRLDRWAWIGVALLGLSLAFKPIYLILPLWLAFRAAAPTRRVFVFFAPIAIFGVVFATAFFWYPFDTVIQKVLGHGGANNSPLINALVPGQLAPWVIDHGGAKIAFVLLLVACGWFFRSLPPFELALVYSMTAVLFSWAVVNQYLVTPMAAIAIFMNIGFVVWFGLTSLYFSSTETLSIPIIREYQPYVVLEWNQVMQDLFPWMLLGWVIFIVALRRPDRHMTPRQTSDVIDLTSQGAQPSRR